MIFVFNSVSDKVIFVSEPKKDKTEGASQNGAVSPSTETPSHVSQPPGPGDGIGKLERPNTLAPGKLTRRLLCYHSEHCKFRGLLGVHSLIKRMNSIVAIKDGYDSICFLNKSKIC